MKTKYENLKERIKNNELIGYEYVEKFANNLPGLILFFEAESKIHTIAHEKVEEFKDLVKGLELRFALFTKSFNGVEY
jgi:archaellum component FlaC